jgi:DNA-directed RNA polymerase subunit omega
MLSTLGVMAPSVRSFSRLGISGKVSVMLRSSSPFDNQQLMRRTEDLVQAASNRYRITVQVANRAQRRRYEEFESLDDTRMKPVLRAIIEMSDELTQPEILGE